MKMIVLTGPGEVNKRSEMLSYKKSFDSEAIFIFDLSSKNIKEIEICLSSQSLFNTSDKLIIAENTPDDLDLKKMVKAGNSATMVFLSGSPKSISKLLVSAKEINAKVINFEAEKETTAFAYLDALMENKQDVFAQMQELMNIYGGMYILAMIYYLLRRNLLPLPSSSFMQKKIKAQKEKLNEEDFKKLYLMTLNTDFAIKTGLPEEVALSKLTQEFTNYLR